VISPWGRSLLWQLRQTLFPAGTWRERAARGVFRRIVQSGRLVGGLTGRQFGAIGAGAPPVPMTYDRWIQKQEPDASRLELQRGLAMHFRYRPLISVICPVFAPPPSVLVETIASVRAQTYDNWELVLVKAGAQPEGVATVLTACGDERQITVVDLDDNLGIAGNTNRGLAAARGEYVAFLDHDDLIAPDTLYEVVRLLNDAPDTDVVYFDEDKVAADGIARSDPYFKPEWSPEHLLSINYLMHSVVRRATIEAVGGLNPEFDGAQDWDLALRLLEHGVTPRHIPRVLYHWRKLPGSAASDATAKPWALAVQAPCVKAHLERRGFTGVVVDTPALGVLRPRWEGRGSRVSIIIPTRDRAHLVRKCLASLTSLTRYPDYEVLLVDTGSAEPETAALYEELAHDPRIRLLTREGKFNYSGVNNWAAAQATGDILLFLNNDVEVLEPGWLEELARWAELEEIGCVGAKLLYPDGTIQHAGLVVGLEGHASQIFRFEAGDHHWSSIGSPEFYRNALALTGACLAVRRDVFRKVAGFDESLQLCYNDIDLCLRVAAAGYRNLYTPFARLTHHEGASRGFAVPKDDALRASIQMLPLVMFGDPTFSPSLSYGSVSPQLASEYEPEARGERIALIARNIGIFDEWTHAIEREIRGESRAWDIYRSLLPRTGAAATVARTTQDRLRILLVTHDLSRTGAPMLAAHLTHYLHNLGHDVTVVSPKPGPMREEFETRGARVVVCPGILMTPYVLDELVSSQDVVLANTILSWRVVVSTRAAGRPCLWIIHESNFGYEYARAHRSIAQAFASATRVIFPSLETEGRYRQYNAGRQMVIHYGIEPVTARAKAFEKEPGKLYVMLVGSIEPRKGQDVLVAALRRLPPRVLRSIEVIVLGGALDYEFDRRVRAAAAPLGCVRFLAPASYAQMIDLMATADVLVCASRDDPSPLVVFEAMGLGRAVLSTRVGAVPELILDGESGLLVDKGDSAAMAAALVRLHDDKALVERLGARARERFEEHLTLERYGADILAEIKVALNAR
jgi:GT2 family glycosyltransferase/glycosyltransferase involved in cell wall biosynthesis